MKVRYTDTALAEINDILSYIAEDNPLAAEEVGAIAGNSRSTGRLSPLGV